MISNVKEIGLGNILSELKNQIQKIKEEIKEIDNSFTSIPEMIESTNILRENESLILANNKKAELIAAYEQYTRQIENLLSSAFEIQNDLKDIVKVQSELIGSENPEEKNSVKTKMVKKSKKKVEKKIRLNF